MKNKLTGQCLIINNEYFDKKGNLSTRTGAKIDEDRFEKLFKKLNFEVKKISNSSKDKILKVDLKAIASANVSQKNKKKNSG